MNRNTWLALLVCLNVALVAAIALSTVALPRAHAQDSAPTGLANDYLVVAGEIQDQYDALYVLSLRDRALHVLYWEKGRREIQYVDYRDLERDFRNNRD